MRDDMKLGDLVLFYHSNCKPPHVAGVARVCKEGYPDHTAQDPTSNYFDAKATPENPRWIMVDIEHVQGMPELVSLPDMRANAELEGMLLLQRFMRLSVQSVSKKNFKIVCHMGGLSSIPGG
jgi:predicted RNA-binding protein with PUA-like domain